MRLKLIASSLGLIASLTITQLAKADDDHRGKGHRFCGVETFTAHIVLSATNDMTNAVGQLNLQAFNNNGTTNSQMQIQTFGLAQGDYTVAATLKSDGSSVNIGTITVGNPHWRDREIRGHAYGHYRSANRLVLSGTVDPANISQITVSDTNNVTELVGDLVNLSNRSFIMVRENVQLSPGDVATNATGCATLTVVARGTNVTAFATVSARNLPTNTLLNVAFDTQPMGTVTTTARGTAVLRRINLGNISVQSGDQLTLTTTDGGTAATANF